MLGYAIIPFSSRHAQQFLQLGRELQAGRGVHEDNVLVCQGQEQEMKAGSMDIGRAINNKVCMKKQL